MGIIGSFKAMLSRTKREERRKEKLEHLSLVLDTKLREFEASMKVLEKDDLGKLKDILVNVEGLSKLLSSNAGIMKTTASYLKSAGSGTDAAKNYHEYITAMISESLSVKKNLETEKIKLHDANTILHRELTLQIEETKSKFTKVSSLNNLINSLSREKNKLREAAHVSQKHRNADVAAKLEEVDAVIRQMTLIANNKFIPQAKIIEMEHKKAEALIKAEIARVEEDIKINTSELDELNKIHSKLLSLQKRTSISFNGASDIIELRQRVTELLKLAEREILISRKSTEAINWLSKIDLDIENHLKSMEAYTTLEMVKVERLRAELRSMGVSRMAA